MIGKKIVIIGGSIAGCTTAILLQRLGANVTILERSAGIIGNGSGITLPESIVNKCIELDLFDSNIPRLNIYGRSFAYKKNHPDYDHMRFWTQPFAATALNWSGVYKNLRDRTGTECYITNTEVRQIDKIGDSYNVGTSTGTTYEADLIIAADGVNSTIRTQFLPDINPEYTGYVAWRGVVEDQSIVSQTVFNEHAPYYVFPNGHLLLYRIPSADYKKTEKTVLNWVMYENRQEHSLDQFLIDKNGIQHTRSLPAGSLTDTHIHYLHELSKSCLPLSISDLIIQTPKPFIQAVFDFQLPPYSSNQVIFVGDAAATLRPHTASGVFKALKDGIELDQLIRSNDEMKISDLVSAWKRIQQLSLLEEVQKAKVMGDALVTNPPDWTSMNQELTDEWWARVMHKKTWYATSRINGSPLSNNSIFSPADSKDEPLQLTAEYTETSSKP